jgi:16S rRNA (guanine527-N7)-methyltransferase
MAPQISQLKEILRTGEWRDGKRFSASEIELISNHYELTLKWNDRLHLTTLTQPQDFFERHILESAFAESLILPCVHQIWDLGSGLGVPGVVLAVLRPGLTVHLVETSRNKAVFLEEVVGTLPLTNARVVRARFESFGSLPPGSCLIVRAVERMEKMLPEMVRLGTAAAQILIFGGRHLKDEVSKFLTEQWQIKCSLLPGSHQRYLINISRST